MPHGVDDAFVPHEDEESLAFTKPPAGAANRAFRIGRFRGGMRTDYAFTLRRKEGGGMSISNVEGTLTTAERHGLMVHFGKVHAFDAGGDLDGMQVTVNKSMKPGTEEHFLHAVRSLPEPFEVMPKGAK